MTLKPISRFLAYLMLLLAGLVGGGGIFIFMFFLFSGPLDIVNLGLVEAKILLLDLLLCLAFFAQHSIMARTSFRQRVTRFLPAHYFSSFYAIVSGVVVLVLVLFWQESAHTLMALQGLVRMFLRAVFILAIVGVLWTLSMGFVTQYRLQPILDNLRETKPQSKRIISRGPYRWVRHPLYLLSLFLIWSYPDLTTDRLLFNLLFTIWVVAGTLLEERDLTAAFGRTYRSYQHKVPMFFPWRARPD